MATENKQSKQKKVKGTIGTVDRNLKSPPLFEVTGKITSVERSGVERSAESDERMTKEDVVRKMYPGAARKKTAYDGGDDAVAIRRSNRAK